jgi:broad specificity phosphatase PhoE
MKIYFIRHGESESNRIKRLTGTLNSPLTNEGIEQTKKVSSEIPLDFSEIYSADCIRCKQTSEIINEKLKISITYDPRLRQRNFGSLGGKTWEEIGEDLKEIDKNQQYDYRPHGGEQVGEVRERVFSFMKDIKTKHPNKKILVVTSGGIIRLLHHTINGKIIEHISNNSIHEFEF